MRQTLASLVLVLFALQSYVTQTHIHFLSLVSGRAQAANVGANAQNHGKLPPADNPTTCPICQDMALAGHYTAPGAILLTLPPLVAMPVQASLEVPHFVAAVSHIWLGRAPPHN
ncbi:MAG: hypothetical protein KGR48_02060 [Alphaproteobacteria bacterium]|nr:hypothetical protein [Alphaproteobacteria bacterium]MDE2011453.1 hypothetical protein [Alphaproteobacteria bacterium]MDE2071844.1 hypothetical protein [Alphaproteobacteria bacterium]MDE2350483.1 hypothetical protein [Alphaproteobacteria bacterium]